MGWLGEAQGGWRRGIRVAAVAAAVIVVTVGVASASEPAEVGVLRVAVIADLNERYGDQFHRDTVHAAIEQVGAYGPDLVLVPGDMVAGQRPGLDYDGMWSAFRQAVVEPLQELPLAIAPGNHDASEYERYAEERDVYGRVWGTPDELLAHEGIEAVDVSGYPFRYAFRMGPALFVALDATSRRSLDEEQLDWLEAVLGRVDRGDVPVRVLFGHFPLYPLAEGRERDYLLGRPEVRQRFEALVVEHGVDAWVSGHHHSYYPGRDPSTGLLLLGAGCLGGGPRPLLGEGRVIEDRDDPRERSWALLEIDRGGVRAVTAFRGPGFEPGERDRIDPEELPARVGEIGRYE